MNTRLPDPLLPPGPTRRGQTSGPMFSSPQAGRVSDGAPLWEDPASYDTASGSLAGGGNHMGDSSVGMDAPRDDLGEGATDARRRLRSWRTTIARVRRVEGERGIAVRWSVALRYLSYVGVILVCVGVTNATFRGTAWSMGGTLMLFSAAMMAVTAAAGSMFMPQKRVEIAEQLRHFLFQISLLPGTAIALFMWVMNAYVAKPGHQDNFLGLLHNSLPILYAFTVFFPALIFVKAVAGYRVLDKTQQDDQELMATWTRQDRYVV